MGLIGLVLLLATAVAEVTLLRSAEAGWRRFDDERQSPLYCRTPLLSLVREGPEVVAPFGLSCLPRRIDHAPPHAPGRPRPEAFCILEGVPCG